MQGNLYKKNETFNIDEAVQKAQVQAAQQAAESAKEAAQRAEALIGTGVDLAEIEEKLNEKLNKDGSNANGVVPIAVSFAAAATHSSQSTQSERAEQDITGNDITSYVYNVFVEDGILTVTKGNKSSERFKILLSADDALSETSEKPVQNKVVTEAISSCLINASRFNDEEIVLHSFAEPSQKTISAASPKYVDDAIGDVETALETIIAKYGLGGDSV